MDFQEIALYLRNGHHPVNLFLHPNKYLPMDAMYLRDQPQIQMSFHPYFQSLRFLSVQTSLPKKSCLHIFALLAKANDVLYPSFHYLAKNLMVQSAGLLSAHHHGHRQYDMYQRRARSFEQRKVHSDHNRLATNLVILSLTKSGLVSKPYNLVYQTLLYS